MNEQTQSARPGRHRLPRAGHHRASGFRPSRTIATVVTVAALAAVAFAVGTGFGSPSPRPAAASVLSVPQLTKTDIQQLEHLTPTEAARFTKEVDTAYSKMGIHVGVATVGTAAVLGPYTHAARVKESTPRTTLTSYQWSGGVQWNHLWVTASYANLQPIANNLGAVTSVATAFCTKLPGWFAVGCGAVGALISYFLSRVHVTNWSSSHGVWGAYYWLPWRYETGGTW
jgi:hypothetical protein